MKSDPLQGKCLHRYPKTRSRLNWNKLGTTLIDNEREFR